MSCRYVPSFWSWRQFFFQCLQAGERQDGFLDTLGFNYRDDWSKKVTVSKTVQNNLSGQLPSTQNSNSTRNDRNLNHRVHLNIEYKPDTLNYFKFSPKFSYGGVRSNETFASRLREGRRAPVTVVKPQQCLS